MEENKRLWNGLKKFLSFALISLTTVGATLLVSVTSERMLTFKAADSMMEAFRECDLEPRYGAEIPSGQPDPTPYTGFGAQTADYFEQPSFVVDYFANLTEHFPTNNSGNCGYTAAAMLLSYYDVY